MKSYECARALFIRHSTFVIRHSILAWSADYKSAPNEGERSPAACDHDEPFMPARTDCIERPAGDQRQQAVVGRREDPRVTVVSNDHLADTIRNASAVPR